MMPKLEPGWMMHIKGVGDLAERLGPEPFSSGILHSMFMGFRPLLVSRERLRLSTQAVLLIICDVFPS